MIDFVYSSARFGRVRTSSTLRPRHDWLPDHFKRWYRMNFALLPVMAIAVVVVVFVLYQFVTSDLQAFIYFQF